MAKPQESIPGWGGDLGEPIAVLGAEPDQLATDPDIHFASGHDDLDYVRVALVAAPSGTTYALVRHERSTAPGTEVVARSQHPPATLASDLQGLLVRLGLGDDAVTWIRPDLVSTWTRRRAARAKASSR